MRGELFRKCSFGGLFKMTEILSPYNKLPDSDTLYSATILIVGAEGTGKHDLAKGLVGVKTSFSLGVRTATSLPLPDKNQDNRPKIDFIVFLVDLINRESMKTVENSLKYLDINYFLGKVCFVVLNAKNNSQRNVGIDAMSHICDTYDSPMICGSLETDMEQLCLARRILHLTEIAAGFKPNVTSFLIGATSKPYQTELPA